MADLNKFFLDALGNGNKIKSHVENNVDLVNHVKTNKPFILPSAKLLINLIGKEKTLKNFNYEGIMILLRSERPDLFKDINYSEKARLWLYNQIENFKNYF